MFQMDNIELGIQWSNYHVNWTSRIGMKYPEQEWLVNHNINDAWLVTLLTYPNKVILKQFIVITLLMEKKVHHLLNQFLNKKVHYLNQIKNYHFENGAHWRDSSELTYT